MVVTTYADGYDVYGNVVAKLVNGSAVAKYGYKGVSWLLAERNGTGIATHKFAEWTTAESSSDNGHRTSRRASGTKQAVTG